MGLWDYVVDNVDTVSSIYNIYDNYKSGKQQERDIRSGDPYGAVNALAARDLEAIYRDSGRGYLASEAGQNSLAAYRTAYDRKNSKDRLGTGADDRRGMNELTIEQQIINDRISQLQGTPQYNQQTGTQLAELRDQRSFNRSYGVADLIKNIDLGGIFNRGSNNNVSTSSGMGMGNRGPQGGSSYGWFE